MRTNDNEEMLRGKLALWGISNKQPNLRPDVIAGIMSEVAAVNGGEKGLHSFVTDDTLVGEAGEHFTVRELFEQFGIEHEDEANVSTTAAHGYVAPGKEQWAEAKERLSRRSDLEKELAVAVGSRTRFRSEYVGRVTRLLYEDGYVYEYDEAGKFLRKWNDR